MAAAPQHFPGQLSLFGAPEQPRAWHVLTSYRGGAMRPVLVIATTPELARERVAEMIDTADRWTIGDATPAPPADPELCPVCAQRHGSEWRCD